MWKEFQRKTYAKCYFAIPGKETSTEGYLVWNPLLILRKCNILNRIDIKKAICFPIFVQWISGNTCYCIFCVKSLLSIKDYLSDVIGDRKSLHKCSKWEWQSSKLSTGCNDRLRVGRRRYVGTSIDNNLALCIKHKKSEN